MTTETASVAARLLAALYPDGLDVADYESALEHLTRIANAIAPPVSEAKFRTADTDGDARIPTAIIGTAFTAPAPAKPVRVETPSAFVARTSRKKAKTSHGGRPNKWGVRFGGAARKGSPSPFRTKFNDEQRLDVLATYIRKHGPVSMPKFASYVHVDPDWVDEWMRAAEATGAIVNIGGERRRFALPKPAHTNGATGAQEART